uniref:nitric oxide dioxygenase n=1 Tax=Timspurckia oligopyrenoides TaxID=708627 RepID=A0A6T6LXB8_9RHOD|mmetsp:Transcript_13722/g.24625  ORF Transcript_13722/g.24625 Transcript_13722/m.24625 type:complete len:292 (+) Transcript_13722:2-877(+)|eukprot:CAMPEP_0182443168 /NCGR_PEP_ID=MMETSP1172-20130603/1964_1 /TAXON_ID=708627 /ORGANISM="Timspurckia oligopyrenoides, Strain CCMP3278" /LENGTH=291 /DNA_ID=CAMNT_0024638345 /DNA_START=248 /DNA_END=1123 /DNA_ORIENTATION=-
MASLDMSPAEIQLLKASAKTLQRRGPEIATRMYENLFTAVPDVKVFFSTAFLEKQVDEDGKTQTTLMGKIMAHILFQFCMNIENLDRFKDDCERVSAKHVSRGIKPEFYPFYGDALILALKQVMGDEATDQTLAAWRKAYDRIASMFIATEKRMTAEVRDQIGGWEGFRTFRVAERVEEADVTSLATDDSDDEYEETETRTVFTLEPVDGNKTLPVHKLGQYVCIRYKMDGVTSHRNYTLQSITDNKMVLAIKHADETPTSKYMIEKWQKGFEVETSPPVGTFLLMETLSV